MVVYLCDKKFFFQMAKACEWTIVSKNKQVIAKKNKTKFVLFSHLNYIRLVAAICQMSWTYMTNKNNVAGSETILCHTNNLWSQCFFFFLFEIMKFWRNDEMKRCSRSCFKSYTKKRTNDSFFFLLVHCILVFYDLMMMMT